MSSLCVYNSSSWAVFSYKLRYIVGLWLVEMAISTNHKPTIYRNLYENTAPGFYYPFFALQFFLFVIPHILMVILIVLISFMLKLYSWFAEASNSLELNKIAFKTLKSLELKKMSWKPLKSDFSISDFYCQAILWLILSVFKTIDKRRIKLKIIC